MFFFCDPQVNYHDFYGPLFIEGWRLWIVSHCLETKTGNWVQTYQAEAVRVLPWDPSFSRNKLHLRLYQSLILILFMFPCWCISKKSLDNPSHTHLKYEWPQNVPKTKEYSENMNSIVLIVSPYLLLGRCRYNPAFIFKYELTNLKGAA